MQRRPDHEEVLVRYLLGDLPEDERAKLEEDYFTDDAMFEQMLVVKDELIDLYARGQLEGRERERFEQHFLSTTPRRRRLDEAREFIEAATAVSLRTPSAPAAGAKRGADRSETGTSSSSSWWRSLMAPFLGRSPALGFALAALLLVAALGGFWALFKRPPSARQNDGGAESEQQLARGEQQDVRDNPSAQQTPQQGAGEVIRQPPAAESSPELPRVGGPTQSSGDASPRTSPTQGTERAPTRATGERERDVRTVRQPSAQPESTRGATAGIASLLLSPVLTRGEGEGNTLLLPAETRSVRLRLAFRRGDYRGYRAVLRTVEGAEVWRSGTLKAARTGDRLNLNVPPALFSKSDYILTLTGITPSGQTEDIDEYYFKVRRPNAP